MRYDDTTKYRTSKHSLDDNTLNVLGLIATFLGYDRRSFYLFEVGLEVLEVGSAELRLVGRRDLSPTALLHVVAVVALSPAKQSSS